MTIHRLTGNGRRKYGKAHTLCGLDVTGQIHPSAEVFSDGVGSERAFEPSCSNCEGVGNRTAEQARARAGYATVHALHHGLPLCGYGEGKQPCDWPAGQAWLAVTEIGRRIDDRGLSQWCQACLQKASEGGLPAAAAGTTVLDHMREPKNPDDGMRRFEVWSLRTIGNGGVDLRVGEAIENRDGTISLQLPALGVRLRLKGV